MCAELEDDHGSLKPDPSCAPFPLARSVSCDPAAACLLIAAAGSATNVELNSYPCKHASAANPEGPRVLLLGAHVLTVVMKSSEIQFIQLTIDPSL
jgi:hypothetical protein